MTYVGIRAFEDNVKEMLDLDADAYEIAVRPSYFKEGTVIPETKLEAFDILKNKKIINIHGAILYQGVNLMNKKIIFIIAAFVVIAERSSSPYFRKISRGGSWRLRCLSRGGPFCGIGDRPARAQPARRGGEVGPEKGRERNSYHRYQIHL